MSLLGGGLRPVCHCGSGSYGDVWLATDSIGRAIAVKIVSKARRGTAWRREMESIRAYCAKVPAGTPHLLAIYHVAEGEDFFCYSMEAADNATAPSTSSASDPAPSRPPVDPGTPYTPDTLARRLAAGGRFPPAQTRTVMAQALEGLRVLHGYGLIHRDIKPENILFVDGRLKLGDIGCVAFATPEASLVGTLHYLPPEVVSGTGTPSPAQDVYALGKVLYCLLSGLDASRFPSVPISALKTRTERDLNAVMLRACEPDAAARYPTAEAFAQALDACWEGGFTGFAHRFCRRILAAWKHHVPLFAALLAILATLGVLVGALALRNRRTPETAPAPPRIGPMRPGSVRTEHVRSPARSANAPVEPASPRSIRVAREAGLPLVTALTLQDAVIHARSKLAEPVVLLASDDGQFGILTRGRVAWSADKDASVRARNAKFAREEAFATARDLLATTFLAQSADAPARYRRILRALASDPSATPLFKRLRTIEPRQKIETFLRGYALDSLVETTSGKENIVTVTLLATVETCSTSVALDHGILVATQAEGAFDKIVAELMHGCLPESGALVLWVETEGGRRFLIRIAYAAVLEGGDAAAAAELARLHAERELARFDEPGNLPSDRFPDVFRTQPEPGSAWTGEVADDYKRRLKRILSRAPEDESSRDRLDIHSESRDGWAYHAIFSTRLQRPPSP
ncbi:MAG: serine/threonine protein kinase [Kiritimatiellia bacterium]